MKKIALILLAGLLFFASPLYAGQILRGSGGAPAGCSSSTAFGETTYSSDISFGTASSSTTGPISITCSRNGTFDIGIYISANEITRSASFGVYLDANSDGLADVGDTRLCTANITVPTTGGGDPDDFLWISEGITCNLTQGTQVFFMLSNSTDGIINSGRNTAAAGGRYYYSTTDYYGAQPANLETVGSRTASQEFMFQLRVP